MKFVLIERDNASDSSIKRINKLDWIGLKIGKFAFQFVIYVFPFRTQFSSLDCAFYLWVARQTNEYTTVYHSMYS